MNKMIKKYNEYITEKLSDKLSGGFKVAAQKLGIKDLSSLRNIFKKYYFYLGLILLFAANPQYIKQEH